MSYQVLEENFLSGSPLTQDRKDCRPKFYIGDDLTHNRIRITKVRDFEEKIFLFLLFLPVTLVCAYVSDTLTECVDLCPCITCGTR